MRGIFFILLFFSFLYSCNSDFQSSNENSSSEKINPYRYTGLANSQDIENPIFTVSIKSLPRNIDIVGKAVPVNVSIDDFNCIDEKEKTVCIFRFNFGNNGGRIHFSQVKLPKDSHLLVFDKDFIQDLSNPVDNDFWSINFSSNSVYVYFDYSSNLLDFPFVVDKVMYIWNKPIRYSSEIETSYAQKTECEIYDVKCFTDTLDNDVWRFAKSSAMIITSDDTYTYQCSGNLISSKKHPNDPILITSAHCFKDEGMVKDAVFWFDYMNSRCNSYDSYKNRHYTIGGKLLDISRNDIALVEIKGKLNPEKYKYTWVNWEEEGKCGGNFLGFSYPRENPLSFHEGYLSDNSCYIDFNKESKSIYISCRKVKENNGFKINWSTGSIDLGSSGSALLRKCLMDNDEKWILVGVLSGRDRGCNPPTGIYSDFFNYIKHSEEGNDILTNGLPEDYYEENDNMETAYIDGYFSQNRCDMYWPLIKMTIRDNDEDWFGFYLPKGCKLRIEADFINQYGNIDLFLYDANGNLIKQGKQKKEKREEVLSYKSNEDQFLYLRAKLKDDLFQTYSIHIHKDIAVDPPEFIVTTDEDKKEKSFPENSFLIIKRYYTNKDKFNVYVDIKDNFYSKDELGVCINRFFSFCYPKYVQPYKEKYTLNLEKEKKYRFYISVRNKLLSSKYIYKLYIYHDKTPPIDGNVDIKRENKKLTFILRNFSDNLSGINQYYVSYSEKPLKSCREGKVVYKGKNTEFSISFRKGFYRICAEDKAGNLSNGIPKYIK